MMPLQIPHPPMPKHAPAEKRPFEWPLPWPPKTDPKPVLH